MYNPNLRSSIIEFFKKLNFSKRLCGKIENQNYKGNGGFGAESYFKEAEIELNQVLLKYLKNGGLR